MPFLLKAHEKEEAEKNKILLKKMAGGWNGALMGRTGKHLSYQRYSYSVQIRFNFSLRGTIKMRFSKEIHRFLPFMSIGTPFAQCCWNEVLIWTEYKEYHLA